jgi:hypothetical protein
MQSQVVTRALSRVSFGFSSLLELELFNTSKQLLRGLLLLQEIAVQI